jgi:photosystem II stability/assembly factor-like uncharacterized protein
LICPEVKAMKLIIVPLALMTFFMTGCGGPTEPISLYWRPIALLPASDYYNGIYFTDQKHGWVIGNSGKVFRTTDGGENWQLRVTGSTQDFHCVAFIDDHNGWIGGKGNTILHTTDAGDSWSLQYAANDTLRRFLSMSIVDSQTGWVASNFGEILHTSDAGQFWEVQQSGTQWALTSVHFIDQRSGWAVATNKIVLRTTDGGTHWNTQISLSPSAIICTDIKFVDEQRGWITTSVAASSSIQSGSPPPLFRRRRNHVDATSRNPIVVADVDVLRRRNPRLDYRR